MTLIGSKMGKKSEFLLFLILTFTLSSHLFIICDCASMSHSLSSSPSLLSPSALRSPSNKIDPKRKEQKNDKQGVKKQEELPRQDDSHPFYHHSSIKFNDTLDDPSMFESNNRIGRQLKTNLFKFGQNLPSIFAPQSGSQSNMGTDLQHILDNFKVAEEKSKASSASTSFDMNMNMNSASGKKNPVHASVHDQLYPHSIDSSFGMPSGLSSKSSSSSSSSSGYSSKIASSPLGSNSNTNVNQYQKSNLNSQSSPSGSQMQDFYFPGGADADIDFKNLGGLSDAFAGLASELDGQISGQQQDFSKQQGVKLESIPNSYEINQMNAQLNSNPFINNENFNANLGPNFGLNLGPNLNPIQGKKPGLKDILRHPLQFLESKKHEKNMNRKTGGTASASPSSSSSPSSGLVKTPPNLKTIFLKKVLGDYIDDEHEGGFFGGNHLREHGSVGLAGKVIGDLIGLIIREMIEKVGDMMGSYAKEMSSNGIDWLAESAVKAFKHT